MGLSERTVLERERLWRAFERSTGVKLRRATRRDVDRWYAGLAGRSAATRLTYLAHLRAYFVEAGLPDRTDHIRRPRRPEYVPRPVRDVDRDFLLAVLEQPVRTWVALMVLGGLRCVEVARLRRGDVVEDAPGRWSARVVGKGDRPRVVPLHPIIVECLDSYGWPTVGAQQVSRRTARTLRRHGVDATAHQLRHTAGTDFYAASGGDAFDTARFLGHAKVSTTMLYAATAVEGRRATVDRMA
jgi:integrase